MISETGEKLLKVKVDGPAVANATIRVMSRATKSVVDGVESFILFFNNTIVGVLSKVEVSGWGELGLGTKTKKLKWIVDWGKEN